MGRPSKNKMADETLRLLSTFNNDKRRTWLQDRVDERAFAQGEQWTKKEANALGRRGQVDLVQIYGARREGQSIRPVGVQPEIPLVGHAPRPVGRLKHGCELQRLRLVDSRGIHVDATDLAPAPLVHVDLLK